VKKKAKQKRKRLTGPIHARIAELRESKKMSQEDLAIAVGVDATAVSHWENRIARPDLSRISAVADALGVSVEDLIDGEQAA
jgi:HTH-type transcriptional repressor of puuD